MALCIRKKAGLMSKAAKTVKPDLSRIKLRGAPKGQAMQAVKAPAVSSDTPNPNAPRPVIVGPVMRKKELIDLVVERSGIKKKDAKPVVDAMLAVLGEALNDSRELNLLPMGKFKVLNEKDLGNGKMMRVKVRQVDAKPAPRTGLGIDADSSDD
jgi:nucleoid DNA-binding protein